MADHTFRCGDILTCVSGYYARQLQIENQSGIVMDTKPYHIRLWYESSKRSFWLNYELLKKADDSTATPLLKRIQFLTYAVNAEEWEMEESPSNTRLLCYAHDVSLETLAEIKTQLGSEYKALNLAPEGMGRMIVQIEWIASTPA